MTAKPLSFLQTVARGIYEEYEAASAGEVDAYRRFHKAAPGRRNDLVFMLRESGATFPMIARMAGISTTRASQIYQERKAKIPEGLRSFSRTVAARARVDASQPGDIRDEWIGTTDAVNFNKERDDAEAANDRK